MPATSATRDNGRVLPRLLVVEDDQLLNELLVRYFGDREFDVTSARDGMEALYLLAKHRPDVLLLDAQMPRMDGVQLLKEMRSQGVRLPVVLLTGYAGMFNPDDTASLRKLGVMAILSKPCEFRILHDAVRGLIEQPIPSTLAGG